MATVPPRDVDLDQRYYSDFYLLKDADKPWVRRGDLGGAGGSGVVRHPEMLLKQLGDPAHEVSILRVFHPPNTVIEPHSHSTRATCFILRGSVTVGGRLMEPGDVYSVAPNTVYGPLEMGPEGCEFLDIFGAAPPSGAGTEWQVPGWWERDGDQQRRGRAALEASDRSR